MISEISKLGERGEFYSNFLMWELSMLNISIFTFKADWIKQITILLICFKGSSLFFLSGHNVLVVPGVVDAWKFSLAGRRGVGGMRPQVHIAGKWIRLQCTIGYESAHSHIPTLSAPGQKKMLHCKSFWYPTKRWKVWCWVFMRSSVRRLSESDMSMYQWTRRRSLSSNVSCKELSS